MKSEVAFVEFPWHGDERGKLVVVEGEKDIPFDIKRIFYIYGSDGNVVRGKHANRKSSFVLVNVMGSCRVKVMDGRGGGEHLCTGSSAHRTISAADDLEGDVRFLPG